MPLHGENSWRREKFGNARLSTLKRRPPSAVLLRRTGKRRAPIQRGFKKLKIGVGMALSRHPSLRTGRADFPHPALRLMGSQRERARSSRGLQGHFPFNSIIQVICAWLNPRRHSPRGHSQRFAGCRPVQRPSIFLLPLRSTIVTRFLATMGALTSSRAVLRPPRGMNSVAQIGRAHV